MDTIFNIFKRIKNTVIDKELPLEENLLNRFEDSLALTYRNRNAKLKENTVWQEIQTYDKGTREKVAPLALVRLIDKDDRKYHYSIVRRKVFKSEFNPKNPPSKESLQEVFDYCLNVEAYYSYQLPPKDLLFCFQYYKETYGKDSHYTKAKNALVEKYNNHSYGDANLKKIALTLENMDFEGNDATIYDRRDGLGEYLDKHWDSYDDTFKAIIAHCWELGQKAKPTAKWTKKSNELLQDTPNKEELVYSLSGILEFLIRFGKAEVKRKNEGTGGPINHHYLYEPNEIAVSYLVWFAGMMDHQLINTLIGQLALTSYSKIRWIGSLSTKNGNACLYAFTLMSPKAGITQLLNIRNKTRNKAIKNTANKQLTRKAQELGISEEALLELSVPAFNLEDNLSKWVIAGYTGVIDITDMSNPSTYWINNTTSKQQKSIPKEVKDNHQEELKAFKSTLKDVKTAISVHAKRLENSYLDNIEWTLADWRSNYLEHPFLSRYASKLIWWFDDQQTGILSEGQVLDVDQNPIDVSQYQTVKLWHPIYSDLETVTAWRTYILDEEIKQPFKQAYREIYVVTDAEITTNVYSNRFAAHVLYQHQFTALAKTRDWSYTLQGAFDSHNTPTKSIPKFKMAAQFWVEPISDDMGGSGIYTYVASDQVRFHTGMEVLEMADVPKIVFSEIMRDVDLFVGVASIGNNPQWEDAGERRNYWHNYSFGKLSETAKTRKAVLERIVPKLKIADRCVIEDKFLVVEGKIRRYKIHLGSGNILMTPNDQYLCIVPSSRNAKSKIFLPFDNDRTLSIIISKAFLLYDDDKITDTTITRQIKL